MATMRKYIEELDEELTAINTKLEKDLEEMAASIKKEVRTAVRSIPHERSSRYWQYIY